MYGGVRQDMPDLKRIARVSVDVYLLSFLLLSTSYGWILIFEMRREGKESEALRGEASARPPGLKEAGRRA